MVTVAEIARAAEVSRYTVSKVLNGDASVKPATRKRIHAICDRLGYIPNRNALGLVRGKTDLIALVVPYVTDQFYSAMIEKLERLAARRGYMLIYKSSYNDSATERKIIRSFLSLKVCGLFSVPALPAPDRATHELAEKNVPVIYLDRPFSPDCRCVLNNNYGGAAAMTGHLLEKTADLWYHDSFYGDSNPTAVERRTGYADTMRRHGLEPKFLPVGVSAERQDNERFAYENVSAFLRSGGRCGGIFCVTDAVAFGAAAAVREAGLTPGRDIFLGGHDDLRFGAYANPPITTMRQNLDGICESAFDMLETLLRGESPEPRRKIFDPELIARKSG